MAPERRRFLAAAALAAASACLPLAAQTMPEPVMEVPMLDPWVPPEVRAKALPAAPTSGAALAAQVEAKLRRRFEAAAGPDGALTREQARAAGLGQVARHFGAIDRAGTGAVRFDDYKRFLSERGARLPR